MKKILLLSFLYAMSASAQNNTSSFPVFFNEAFNACEKEEAYFSGTAFVTGKKGEVILYHANGEKAYTGLYLDKLFTIKDGMFTWYDTNGIKLRICNYEKNIMNGQVVTWYDNGKIQDSGYYKNGYPDNTWKSWYPSGALRTISTFSAKKIIGFRETYASRPSVQQPLSSNDVFTSSATPLPSLVYGTNSAAQIYAYAKANKYNIVTATQPNVDNYANARANDRALNNISKRKNETDRMAGKPDAMTDGLYMSFFENGNTKDSGYFKDGVRAGIWKGWNENGTIKTLGKYENSRRSGEWKFYTENGRLQYIRKYKWNGMLANEIKMN